MEKLIIKMGPQIPVLLARAAAGDLIAIGILAAMGISAAYMATKSLKN